MAFTVTPVSSGAQTGGISLPEYVSFTVHEDGDGGVIYLNGVGVTSGDLASAVDLKTMFTGAGLLFRSIPLLRAFRSGPTSDTAAMNQFLANLECVITNINGLGGPPAEPTIQYLSVISNVPGPFFTLVGPGTAGADGDWRIDLRLRHSITN